ncbi:MAG: hypothetical protein ACLFSX_05930, partial [Candidatus Acetothermia bacterium]
NIPLQHLSEYTQFGFCLVRCLWVAVGTGSNHLPESKYYNSDKCWIGQTYAPRRWNFLGPEPFLSPKIRAENEAGIGSGDFHAGKITLIER